MTVHQTVLEYLRVLLSAPAVAGAVTFTALFMFRKDLSSLFARIARIRLPGGGELFASQQEKEQEGVAPNPNPPVVTGTSAAPTLPSGVTLTDEQAKGIVQFIQSERANAALWEYRYLNLYLVRSTQTVLDWLGSRSQGISENLLDSHLQAFVPDARERAAIVSALQNHHLISTGPLIQVTPKGLEYIQWRGPLPPVPGAS